MWTPLTRKRDARTIPTDGRNFQRFRVEANGLVASTMTIAPYTARSDTGIGQPRPKSIVAPWLMFSQNDTTMTWYTAHTNMYARATTVNAIQAKYASAHTFEPARHFAAQAKSATQAVNGMTTSHTHHQRLPYSIPPKHTMVFLSSWNILSRKISYNKCLLFSTLQVTQAQEIIWLSDLK